jgi:hypothetical protein
LFDHSPDSRLYALCDKHLSADASESDIFIATNTAISNGKEILFQLLKTNKIYSEMQLLLGYNHIQVDWVCVFIREMKQSLGFVTHML